MQTSNVSRPLQPPPGPDANVLAQTVAFHRDPLEFLRRQQEEFGDVFGGGARRCVGEPLAHAEIETVVPAVLRTVKLTPLAPEPERMVQRATVLVPQRSLMVRASRL